MSSEPALNSPLAGRTIAIPETRELEVFASMLERRGAQVIRCPLVAILDAPDPAPVLAWCRHFAGGGCDDLILLTGEGLRRLLACIERHEPALRDAFLGALARVRKITRGPKPARVLRELGFRPDISPERPTTEGVIDSLRAHPLAGRRIGVQLYGTEPNRPLIGFLESAGARVFTVAPYVYADQAADQAVLDLLGRLRSGRIDAIAFTSTPQVERLFALAPEDEVKAALAGTRVAAVGPVVAGTLERHGIAVALVPQESFFLKPLTSALEKLFAGATAN
ncbi:MAG: uroporphyrinogen-III synthase [Steroidobacteraceae bacterium]|jgi:uroporphyrinogen-III synthase|nr:uroporphyrinogen-III synthase [Steroidobacteraceae bacterium]